MASASGLSGATGIPDSNSTAASPTAPATAQWTGALHNVVAPFVTPSVTMTNLLPFTSPKPTTPTEGLYVGEGLPVTE